LFINKVVSATVIRHGFNGSWVFLWGKGTGYIVIRFIITGGFYGL